MDYDTNLELKCLWLNVTTFTQCFDNDFLKTTRKCPRKSRIISKRRCFDKYDNEITMASNQFVSVSPDLLKRIRDMTHKFMSIYSSNILSNRDEPASAKNPKKKY